MLPGRAIKAIARSNDPTAIFTFIWLPPPPTTKTIFTFPGMTFNPSARERLRCFTAGTPRAAFLRIREAAIRPQERLCLRAPERTAWHGGGLLRRRDNIHAVRGRNVVAFVKHLLLPQALADRAVLDQSCQAWHDQAPPFAAASNARLTATAATFSVRALPVSSFAASLACHGIGATCPSTIRPAVTFPASIFTATAAAASGQSSAVFCRTSYVALRKPRELAGITICASTSFGCNTFSRSPSDFGITKKSSTLTSRCPFGPYNLSFAPSATRAGARLDGFTKYAGPSFPRIA